MKSSKIVEILHDGNIVIPMYLLKKYKDLKLDLDEFIFLMYIYNKGNMILFDPVTFAKELNIDLEKVMEYVSNLSEKNYLKVDVLKNSKGIIEEIITLEDFYSKITLSLAEDVNNEKKDSTNIIEIIEKEFGRTLSPMEIEIIKAWIDDNISEDLIKEALKEAAFNGVSNLRYIDKILYEWGKKGIKTKEDVQKNRKGRVKKEEKELDLDIMDWDWFDEDEE